MNPVACLVAIFAISVALLMVPPLQAVYGSGGITKEIEPSDWYESKLPFVLSFNTTTIGNDSATIQFTLYENDAGQAVPNVSYIVSITEVESNETLLTDAFYSSGGRVFLNVIHDSRAEDIRIEGTRESFLNAMVADNATEPIVIRGAALDLDRAYNIEIAILAAYNIRDLAPPDQIPVVDLAWNPQDGNMATELVVPEFEMVLLPVLLASVIAVMVGYSRIRK